MKTNNQKKQIPICGRILQLSLGQPAHISTDMGILQTSRVEHFIKYPDGHYWIETANSKYTVSPY